VSIHIVDEMADSWLLYCGDVPDVKFSRFRMLPDIAGRIPDLDS